MQGDIGKESAKVMYKFRIMDWTWKDVYKCRPVEIYDSKTGAETSYGMKIGAKKWGRTSMQ